MVTNSIDDFAELLDGVIHRLQVLLDLLGDPCEPLDKDEETRSYARTKCEVGPG